MSYYEKMSVEELIQTCKTLTVGLKDMLTINDHQKAELTALGERCTAAEERVRELELENARKDSIIEFLGKRHDELLEARGPTTLKRSFVSSEYDSPNKKPITGV